MYLSAIWLWLWLWRVAFLSLTLSLGRLSVVWFVWLVSLVFNSFLQVWIQAPKTNCRIKGSPYFGLGGWIK